MIALAIPALPPLVRIGSPWPDDARQPAKPSARSPAMQLERWTRQPYS
jgi:hypothetical protein